MRSKKQIKDKIELLEDRLLVMKESWAGVHDVRVNIKMDMYADKISALKWVLQ